MYLCNIDKLLVLRKLSFLSLRSLKLSPSPNRMKFVKKSLSSSPNPAYSQTPHTRRKSVKKLLRKSSIFNLNKEDSEKEDHFPSAQPPTFLGQIYKNAKLKLSRSFASVSSFSQVSYTSYSILMQDSLQQKKYYIIEGQQYLLEIMCFTFKYKKVRQ